MHPSFDVVFVLSHLILQGARPEKGRFPHLTRKKARDIFIFTEKSIEKDAVRDSTAERDRRWLKADPAGARNTATALEPPTDM